MTKKKSQVLTLLSPLLLVTACGGRHDNKLLSAIAAVDTPATSSKASEHIDRIECQSTDGRVATLSYQFEMDHPLRAKNIVVETKTIKTSLKRSDVEQIWVGLPGVGDEGLLMLIEAYRSGYGLGSFVLEARRGVMDEAYVGTLGVKDEAEGDLEAAWTDYNVECRWISDFP